MSSNLPKINVLGGYVSLGGEVLPAKNTLTQSKPMKHVYEWLEEPPANEAEQEAKEWLDRFTRPAYDKMKDGTNKWLEQHPLTVEWKSERYQCTGASRMGDVWLKKPGSESFYDHRVDVSELSNWERTL